MGDSTRIACIYVLAGTNGAGKSSVGGTLFRDQDVPYFNPDSAAAMIRAANRDISPSEANSAAWHEGKRLLERAIAERLDFAFETTLGGKTIPHLLASAPSNGVEVRVWYVGLSSAELHIARVQSRVSSGGHNIPEEKIRERFDSSRHNLIDLMPKLAELKVYDNSQEASADGQISPTLILHMQAGKIVESCPLEGVPEWAKPIVAAALALDKINAESV